MSQPINTAELSPAAHDVLLAFADDEHMIGARHTAWIGLGPFLEEDLTFCSIAQDELGHAIALYELVLGLDLSSASDGLQDGGTLDRFALLRPAADYRSCWLAETECSQWNDALVRHWLYDRAEAHRWAAFAGSSHADLAAIAVRAEREESFHREHAEQFLDRMTSSTSEARQLVVDAVERLLPLALGIWDPVSAEPAALTEGFITADSAALGAAWRSDVQSDLARYGIDVEWPTHGPAQSGRTVRSDGFDEFLTGLQDVISIDPAATW